MFVIRSCLTGPPRLALAIRRPAYVIICNLRVLNKDCCRKIWPLFELLPKIRRMLALSCSLNFCNCLHARILCHVEEGYFAPWRQIDARTMSPEWKYWKTSRKLACAMKTMNVSGKMLPRFVGVLLKLTGKSSVPGVILTLPETF